MDAAKNERLSARDSQLGERKAAELVSAERDLAEAEKRWAAAQGAVDDAQTRVDELTEQLAEARDALQDAESEHATAQRTRREAFQALQRVKRRQGG